MTSGNYYSLKIKTKLNLSDVSSPSQGIAKHLPHHARPRLSTKLSDDLGCCCLNIINVSHVFTHHGPLCHTQINCPETSGLYER